MKYCTLPLNPITCSMSQTPLAADLVRSKRLGMASGSAWLSEIAELEQLCKQCEAVDSDVIGEVP